jgi:hypothetical protein
MIHWPAIIKYHGDDELLYVSSQQAWQQDTEVSTVAYQAEDYLIDNEGRLYQLRQQQHGQVEILATDNVIPLDEFIQLVRRHAVAHQQCCVDKIMFRNISEGMQMVASLQ